MPALASPALLGGRSKTVLQAALQAVDDALAGRGPAPDAAREAAAEAMLGQQTKRHVGAREAQGALQVLESTAKAYQTLHDNFLQRFVEATQQQTVTNRSDAEREGSSKACGDPATCRNFGPHAGLRGRLWA